MKRTIEPEESVLLSDWNPPTRPYSQNELKDMLYTLLSKQRLSNITIQHCRCNHQYRVRLNGNKHKSLLEEIGGCADDGADVSIQSDSPCSICWKLRNTPHGIRRKAEELIEEFHFHSSADRLSYNGIRVQQIFYIWLYVEFF